MTADVPKSVGYRGIRSRYLGLRTLGDAFPKRDLGSCIGTATTPRKDRVFLAPSGFGRYRSLTPAAFTSEDLPPPVPPFLTLGTHLLFRWTRNIWKTSKS